MPQHHNQSGVELRRSELGAANLRLRNDVSCYPDDEKVAWPLVENDLNRNSRVGTTQNDREWMLSVSRLRTMQMTQSAVSSTQAQSVPTIPLAKAFKCIFSVQHLFINPPRFVSTILSCSACRV